MNPFRKLSWAVSGGTLLELPAWRRCCQLPRSRSVLGSMPPYRVLGLTASASQKEIKAAYKELAKKWHPDAHQGAAKEKAEEKFKTILQAYQALTGAGRAQQQQQQQYYSNPRTQRGRQARGGHNWGSAEDFGPAGQPGYNPHENYMGFGPGRKGHWCVLSTALHCAVVVL
jgi:DnaJ-class molecular chaperone